MMDRIKAYRWQLFVAGITAIGLIIRLCCFPVVSGDYRVFLKPWYDELSANGGLMAVGRPIGDYLPTYLYILAALTYIPVNSLFAIKAVSILGDLLLAIYAGKIMFVVSEERRKAYAAYSAVWLLPTVILNSAAWGQCDSLYTAALVICVYHTLRGAPTKGMIAYAIAFTLKLQAVFLFPFIAAMVIKKRIPFLKLLYIPVMYLLAILPAALAGRTVVELLTVYYRQTGTYTALSMNAPNFYAFIETENEALITAIGVVAFMLLFLAACVYFSKADIHLSCETILHIAAISALAVPFLLPRMHERYFYPADIFCLLYAFAKPKRWYIAVAQIILSFAACSIFFFGQSWISAAALSIPMCFCLLGLVYDLRGAQSKKTNAAQCS